MSTGRIERDVADALHREVDALPVDTNRALAGLPHRLAVARRRRGAAVVLAVTLALVVAFAVRPVDRDRSSLPVDPPDRVAVVEPRGALNLPLGAGPRRLSLQGSTLWVALDIGSLGRVDTATGRVTRVGELPSAPFDVEPVGDLVWVSLPDQRRIVAVDQQDGRVVHTVDTAAPGPRGMALADGSLWATAGTELLELDPVTGRRLRTLPLRGVALPYDVAVSADSVWVTDSRGRAVTRYRLDTGKAARVDVGGPTVGVVAVGGTVWVGLKEEARLLRVDTATEQVSRGPRLASAPLGLAVIDGELWATAPDADQVAAFDPATGEPRRTWRVGDFPPIVAGDGDTVYVSSYGSHEVVQVPMDQNAG
jgi:streptogramin lyase